MDSIDDLDAVAKRKIPSPYRQSKSDHPAPSLIYDLQYIYM